MHIACPLLWPTWTQDGEGRRASCKANGRPLSQESLPPASVPTVKKRSKTECAPAEYSRDISGSALRAFPCLLCAIDSMLCVHYMANEDIVCASCSRGKPIGAFAGITMASWISIDEESDFSLQNLPYGIFSTSSVDQRIGVAIGDFVLDLKVLANAGIFSNLDFDTLFLEDSTLNRYAGLGRKVHRQVRALLQILLSAETSQGSILRDNASLRERALVPVGEVTLHLPFTIGDYTDFFVVPYHAQNVSC